MKIKNKFDKVRNPTSEEILLAKKLVEKYTNKNDSLIDSDVSFELFKAEFTWRDKDQMTKQQVGLFILKCLNLVNILSSQPQQPFPIKAEKKEEKTNGI